MLIQDQFGIIQNLQMSPIHQTSFLVATFFFAVSYSKPALQTQIITTLFKAGRLLGSNTSSLLKCGLLNKSTLQTLRTQCSSAHTCQQSIQYLYFAKNIQYAMSWDFLARKCNVYFGIATVLLGTVSIFIHLFIHLQLIFTLVEKRSITIGQFICTWNLSFPKSSSFQT